MSDDHEDCRWTIIGEPLCLPPINGLRRADGLKIAKIALYMLRPMNKLTHIRWAGAAAYHLRMVIDMIGSLTETAGP